MRWSPASGQAGKKRTAKGLPRGPGHTRARPSTRSSPALLWQLGTEEISFSDPVQSSQKKKEVLMTFKTRKHTDFFCLMTFKTGKHTDFFLLLRARIFIDLFWEKYLGSGFAPAARLF